MRKRIIYGHLTVLFAALTAMGGTFLLDYLETKTNHPERLTVVFGIAGGVIGFASLGLALMFYSNNMGEGFKNEK